MHLSLEDWQVALVELQHDEIASGRVDFMDHRAIPGAIAELFIRNAIVKPIPKSGPLFSPLSIDDLRVVEIGVVPMPEQTIFLGDGIEFFPAIGEHLRDFFAVVVPCVVESG